MQHLREICDRAKVAGAMQNYANAAATAPRWAWCQLQSHLRFMQRNLPNVSQGFGEGRSKVRWLLTLVHMQLTARQLAVPKVTKAGRKQFGSTSKIYKNK